MNLGVSDLIDCVEYAIERLYETTKIPADSYRAHVAVQPLRLWKNKESAELFRELLKKEFDKWLEINRVQ